MMNLKTIQAAILFTVISVFAACSDQITSSGESFPEPTNIDSAAETSEQIERPQFRTKLKFKPYRIYTFNLANTGLASFYSVDIEKIENSGVVRDLCQDIEVSSSGIIKYDLSCHSKGLDLKEVKVKNIGSTTFYAEIVLTGKKRAKKITEEE